MNVNFLNHNCELIKGVYREAKQNALTLVDQEDGSPVATASVCIPGQPQQEDEVFIKSYSENEGMMESLMLQGVIGGPIGVIPQGFVNFTVHKLLI